MANANTSENLVSGKKYRILRDAAQGLWDRISFWTKASDVDIDHTEGNVTTTETLQHFAERIDQPMTGATASAAGTSGLMIAPAAGDQKKFFTGAGTYVPDAYEFETIAAMNAAITAGTVPADGATVFVEEDTPSGAEGDTELDPTSSNWVQNQAVANGINQIASNIATIETSPSAHAYAVGEHLTYNGVLYRVKSAIAVNDALTVGTNIEAAQVENEIDETEDQIDAIVDFYGSKNVLLIDNVSQTINGVQWVVNSDQTVTATRVSASESDSVFWIFGDAVNTHSYAHDMILSGCPSGGSATTYLIGGANVGIQYKPYTIRANTQFSVALVVKSAYSGDPVTFMPMITDSRIKNQTFVPHVMTNRELTDKKLEIISSTTDIGEGAALADNVLYAVLEG